VANSLTNKVQTVVVQHVNVGDGGEPWSPDRRKRGEKRRAQGTLPQGSDQKMRVNPMDRAGSWRVTRPLAQAAPRCGARNRAGEPCRPLAMANGRCRLDGGLSTGAPRGERRGMWRHGLWSIEAIERRRQRTAEMKELRRLIQFLRWE
jgi:hypothetical protein